MFPVHTTVAVLATLLLGAGGVAGPATAPNAPDPVLTIEVSPSIFCIDCSICDNGVPGHVTNDGTIGFQGTFGGGLHNDTCLSGTCDQAHGICCCDDDQDLALAVGYATELQHAILQGSPSRVAAALAAGRGALQFVKDRQAIQVVGCSGQPVAHYPLVPRLAASLADGQ